MAALSAQGCAIEETYKLPEAEGVLDLYFYRKVGFQLARFFARLRVSPISVTVLGGVFGVVAGHLYYYRDLRINIVGIALHILANALDNADGQLARMTGKGSREGRIIDSVVDHLIFGSVYFHLTLRCMAEGASPTVILLAIAAAVCHALQGGAADYFRNGFLYFTKARSAVQFDSYADLGAEYQIIDWRAEPLKKFLLWLCLNFTRQQEMVMPDLNRLRTAVDREFPEQIPDWLQIRYRDYARPMFKWWGFLMANTRMMVLFVLLLVDQPVWFFWLQLTVFNLLFLVLLVRQNMFLRSTLSMTAANQPLDCVLR